MCGEVERRLCGRMGLAVVPWRQECTRRLWIWMRVAFKIPSVAAFSVYGFMLYAGVVGFDEKKRGGVQE